MGGGDSLYDKIDKGVRGCKVVVSCVTTKYSLSANCRREVSLADALKKPIIPLLLEQMTWPPEGPMSMPFTQLLYVNFCKPDIEIQNHWKVPQFDELLEKLSKHIPKIDFVSDSNPKQSETMQRVEVEKKSEKKLLSETDTKPTSVSGAKSKYQKESDTDKKKEMKPIHVTPEQKKSSACNLL